MTATRISEIDPACRLKHPSFPTMASSRWNTAYLGLSSAALQTRVWCQDPPGQSCRWGSDGPVHFPHGANPAAGSPLGTRSSSSCLPLTVLPVAPSQCESSRTQLQRPLPAMRPEPAHAISVAKLGHPAGFRCIWRPSRSVAVQMLRSMKKSCDRQHCALRSILRIARKCHLWTTWGCDHGHVLLYGNIMLHTQ